MIPIGDIQTQIQSALSQFIDRPNTSQVRERMRSEVERLMHQNIQQGLCYIDGNCIYAEDMHFIQGLIMAGKLNVGEWYEVYIKGEHIGRIRDKSGMYSSYGSIQWDVDIELDKPVDYVKVEVAMKE